MYVTDKLLESRAEIWSAIKSGACIVVSGAAKSMPKDVRQAFTAIIENGIARDYMKEEEEAQAMQARMQGQTTETLLQWSEEKIQALRLRAAEQAERLMLEMQRDKRYIVEAWG